MSDHEAAPAPRTRRSRKEVTESAPVETDAAVAAIMAEEEAEFTERVQAMRDEMPEPVVEEKITAKAPTKTRGRKVKIMIDSERGQPNFKYVGYNGTGYQIKRGEIVVVPEGVAEVLSNAIVETFIQDSDGSRIQQKYLATPFRVLGYVEE